MTTPLDTLVIGAGQAGLAAGYHLQRARRSFAILEAGEQAGGAWPHYYESLRLFSPARYSSLPGLRFPGEGEHYPTRDEVIGYLRQYATHFQLPIVAHARVARVARDDECLVVRTEDGRSFRARSLIAATGAFQRPFMPALPGQAAFGGTTLHSFAYQSPAPFAGQRVVVVGGGNSAVQIAAELAAVAQVTLATREPVRFVEQRPWGRDIHFWWWLSRLDRLPLEAGPGAWFGRLADGKGPRVLDTGVYRAALAAGAPDQRPMFSRLTEEGVMWADGTAEPIDSIIFATGYRPNLGYLAGLGALDAEGRAIQRYGISLTAPGVYYVGLAHQRTYASATLRGVGADAARVVRRINRQLGAAPHPGLLHRLGLLPRQICCPERVA